MILTISISPIVFLSLGSPHHLANLLCPTWHQTSHFSSPPAQTGLFTSDADTREQFNIG